VARPFALRRRSVMPALLPSVVREPPVANKGQVAAAEQAVLSAKEQQRVADKFANFRSAVKVGKDRIEVSSDLRQKRYDIFGECTAGAVAVEVDEVAQSFFEREQAVLRAKRRGWSTEDFDAVCELGSGAFGTVHLVKQKGGDAVFALKQMKKSRYQRKNYRDRAFAERNLLGQAMTRWFVELHATFQDSEHVFMLMEFVQGGELFKYLDMKERFSIEETRFYMAELIVALDVVHRSGFVHRDVKPDNIMLTKSGHLKLLDFGLCKHEVLDPEELNVTGTGRRARLQSKVGTPQYMSPEAFAGEAGAPSDLWSLGIVTFECLYGGVPFHAGDKHGMDAINMIHAMVRGHAKYFPLRLKKAKSFGFIPPAAEQLLNSIICNESVRLSVQGIKQQAFFDGVQFDMIHLAQPLIIPKVNGQLDASNFDDASKRSHLPRRRCVPKDPNLEWAHYEFDRETHALEQPEAVKDLFVSASRASGSPSSQASSSPKSRFC